MARDDGGIGDPPASCELAPAHSEIITRTVPFWDEIVPYTS